MEERIERLRTEALAAIRAAKSLAELDAVRVKYLGKKGAFTAILRGMGNVSKEERPTIGKIVNIAKAKVEVAIEKQNGVLKADALKARLASEKIDVTLPGRVNTLGHLHPLTQTLERIKDIFFRMGFSVEEGPEIEKDYYNFEALNLPKDHPARDMQDSFYITEDILMRSQTSPVQARTMEKNEANAPIRMIAHRGASIAAMNTMRRIRQCLRRLRGSSSTKESHLQTSRGHSSFSYIKSLTMISAFAFVRVSSPSRSLPLKSIFPVSCVMGKAAVSAKARAGLKSLAPAWFIRTSLR